MCCGRGVQLSGGDVFCFFGKGQLVVRFQINFQQNIFTLWIVDAWDWYKKLLI
jgi:hypothetical protein